MTMRAAAMVATAVLALSACKKDGAATNAPGANDPPRATSPAIAELLAGVPGNAGALGFLDIPRAPWSLVTGGWLLPLDEATRKALDKELREYLDRYLGLDVSRLQYAVGFVAGPPTRGAVLFKTVSGALKMPGARDHEGAKVWVLDEDSKVSLAIRGEVVVLGESTSVRDALDTLAGKRKPVTEENKPLVDWLRKESSGAVVAFAVIKPKDLPLPPPLTGIERIAASAGASGIAAVVDGDEASISALQAMSDQAFATMLAEANKARDAAVAGTIGPPQGAIAIIAAAYTRNYAALLKPKRNGNRLSVSLDLGPSSSSAVMVVLVIGSMSAVAIPAFMDYMKRSKKSEAAVQLNKIGKNAKRVFAETGKFPAGRSATPQDSCCGQPNNHCAAAPHLFAADPVWRELDFQIDEPTLYYYTYIGAGDGQSFIAKATADLDCDGTAITYELTGTASAGHPTTTLLEPAPNAD
jgi:type II secretory pathway pseudopilin PulG